MLPSLQFRSLRSNRAKLESLWPILPGSGQPPRGWCGWPEGKRFALVLTHDVADKRGLDKVPALMQIEQHLGFRSSFHFVANGTYELPREFRAELTRNNFEIALCVPPGHVRTGWPRTIRARNIKRISAQLEDWKAVGYRSKLALQDPDWLHALGVAYDSSTWDSDPLQPRQAWMGTVYPFWVPSSRGKGFVELPCTLPDLSTAIRLKTESVIQLWERKLDWLARQGGMALINLTADCIPSRNDSGKVGSLAASIYEEFLYHIRAKYEGQFWHALPRQVANFGRENKTHLALRPNAYNVASAHRILSARRKIWIDFENTPHIPFFKPIIRELEKRGYSVLLTARNAFQTCEMARQAELPHLEIGRHYGRNRLLKIGGLLWRSLQLLPFVRRSKPDLALSHGSRAQILICNLLRIPTVLIMDYEYARTPLLLRPLWEIVPEVLSPETLHCKNRRRIRKFRGIKEDVYVPDFKPDPAIIKQLGLNGDIIVTVRPPATEAHYHNPEAEILFTQFMNRMCLTPGVKVVLLPRNQAQQVELSTRHANWFADTKVVVPHQVLDGLNLLWHSDLAVSGGGTMNREAAALGIPVYSLFKGNIGAVDRDLQIQGRLTLIANTQEVESRIRIERRAKNVMPQSVQRLALQDIVMHVEDIARLHHIA